MKDTKNYIIAILVILCIGLIKDGCDRRKPNCQDYPTYRVDTLTTIDTVWAKDTIIQTVWSKPKPADSVFVPYPILVTAQDSDSLCEVLMNLFQYTRFYSDTAENDDILLIVQDSVRGILTWKAASYKLKVPKEIIKNQTITLVPKFSLYGGIINSYNGEFKTFDIGPTAGFRYKNLYLSFSKGLIQKNNYFNISWELTLKNNKKKNKRKLFF